MVTTDRIPSRIHEARRTLLNGRATEALAMTQVSAQEEYATSHLVRGECYYALGEFEKARLEFREAVRLCPNSPRAVILLELTTSRADGRAPIAPEDPQLPQDTDRWSSATLSRFFTDESYLEGIAEALSKNVAFAASPEPAPSPMEDEPHEEETGLVSETLARIMIKQGKIEEARKVYIQLSRLNPDRYDYFRTCISELEAIPTSK